MSARYNCREDAPASPCGAACYPISWNSNSSLILALRDGGDDLQHPPLTPGAAHHRHRRSRKGMSSPNGSLLKGRLKGNAGDHERGGTPQKVDVPHSPGVGIRDSANGLYGAPRPQPRCRRLRPHAALAGVLGAPHEPWARRSRRGMVRGGSRGANS